MDPLHLGTCKAMYDKGNTGGLWNGKARPAVWG
jgi:hypothetical protein